MTTGMQWADVVRHSSTAWLESQVKESRKLVHEAEQFLRGQTAPDHDHLRKEIQKERAALQVMTEELDRRKADLL